MLWKDKAVISLTLQTFGGQMTQNKPLFLAQKLTAWPVYFWQRLYMCACVWFGPPSQLIRLVVIAFCYWAQFGCLIPCQWISDGSKVRKWLWCVAHFQDLFLARKVNCLICTPLEWVGELGLSRENHDRSFWSSLTLAVVTSFPVFWKGGLHFPLQYQCVFYMSGECIQVTTNAWLVYPCFAIVNTILVVAKLQSIICASLHEHGVSARAA